MYSTIVVGTDGSETAQRAVATAAEIARKTGATVHLVSAYLLRPGAMAMAAGATLGDSDVEALVAETGEVLARAARSFEGVVVQRHALGGAAADVLVAVADQEKADLIVVGSKGMNRRILGSVPNSVAHNAPCAVLIVKTN